MNDVNVHVNVQSGPPSPCEPSYPPRFRDRVAERKQVAAEFLAVVCGLVFASCCVLKRLCSGVAEWWAARRRSRRLVIVVPIETDAWLRAYADRTGCRPDDVICDAIAVARAPEVLAAIRAFTAPPGRTVVRMSTLNGVAATVIATRDPEPRTLSQVFDSAFETAVRRLEP